MERIEYREIRTGPGETTTRAIVRSYGPLVAGAWRDANGKPQEDYLCIRCLAGPEGRGYDSLRPVPEPSPYATAERWAEYACSYCGSERPATPEDYKLLTK